MPKSVVMLVDDEPGIRSALKRTLRNEGYEILLMEDARSALAELEARSVDLVVSDHKMPGMTGVDLLALVKQRWPATRRILLSGWSNEIADEGISAASLSAVLAKPWDEAELKLTIRDALERKSDPSN